MILLEILLVLQEEISYLEAYSRNLHVISFRLQKHSLTSCTYETNLSYCSTLS
jgi:hypothetical protein